jgi:hypothetical protein
VEVKVYHRVEVRKGKRFEVQELNCEILYKVKKEKAEPALCDLNIYQGSWFMHRLLSNSRTSYNSSQIFPFMFIIHFFIIIQIAAS